MKLVIVESPAKAKTISKFLGPAYKVVASYGHIRDLPSSADEIPERIRSKSWARMGVDLENRFEPHYVVSKDSARYVRELKQQLKDADELVLATDEDREGEAISWHLAEVLQPKVPIRRIVFHEITKSAIQEAITNPRDIDDQLVRAQESRRILDRLYGYSLSPVLWKKVRTKLSAGRVQSVAVRLIVEREEERRAFRKAEYWDVEAQLEGHGQAFTATLVQVDGKRVAAGKDFDPDTGQLKKADAVAHLGEAEAKAAAEGALANVPWRVARVEKKQQRQRPQPPFITSTLQQAASSALGMTPDRTMKVAQRLYEGIDLGGGEREGLITYMRTDSTTLSERALAEAGRVIQGRFGDDYYDGPRRYKTRAKGAQEAHEAIRPTHLDKPPQAFASYLQKDELALYSLIYNRTLASQMTDAVLDKTTVDFEVAIDGVAHTFRATGSVVVFPGYLKVAPTSQQDTILPPLEEGQRAGGAGAPVAVLGAKPERHETTPPARYTEASLIRKLEEEGIGRPSTYAPTMSTILARGYVTKKGSALAPTYLGIAVTYLLRQHFPEYVDVNFTARMEEALDEIAEGAEDWVAFLSAFYRGHGKFGDGLEKQIDQKLPEIDFPTIPIGEDPDTGEPLAVRIGRTTAFVQRGDGGEGHRATVPADVFYDELTPERAVELLEASKQGREGLGAHPETGETIYAIEGPFGPYVQLGEGSKQEKPKRASLPRGMALTDVTLADAVKLLALPRTLGDHPESGKAVTAGIGRFGPYVQHDGDFRSLPEQDDVYTVGLERALELLAQPKVRGRRTAAMTVLKELGEHPESKQAVQVLSGRYGPYVSDGSKNATLPKDLKPEEVSLDRALALLAEAPERKGKSRAKAKPKTASKTKAKPKAKPKAKAPAKRKKAGG